MSEMGYRIVALLPRLRGFARSLVRSPDCADDLVQATCEKALRHRESWTPGTSLDSWLFRIMRNHWIDVVRRQRPQVPVDGEDAQSFLPSEDGRRIAEARLELAEIRELVDHLPEEQRTVLLLVCVEDLSYRETAEMLEIPIGTVMSRLARARKAIATARGDDACDRNSGGAR